MRGTHVEGGPFITHLPVCILMGKEMLSLPLTEILATGQTSGQPGEGLSPGRESTGVCACVHPPAHTSVAVWSACSFWWLQAGKRALDPGAPHPAFPGPSLPTGQLRMLLARCQVTGRGSRGGGVTVSLLPGGGLLFLSLAFGFKQGKQPDVCGSLQAKSPGFA